MISTIKMTTQRNLAYRAVSLSRPARLPYKQALSTLTLFDCEFSSISGHLKTGGLVSAWQRINKFIFEIHNNHICTTEWLDLSIGYLCNASTLLPKIHPSIIKMNFLTSVTLLITIHPYYSV